MNALSRIFQTAAEMVFAVLAPATSRVARIAVRFHDELDTASTDGNLIIRMPRSFAGHPIPDDAPVTLGLLAHELGHWVQPLREMTEVAQQRGAPHWLVNIAADIHGESFVEAAFPALKGPLQATRQAVNQAKLNEFQQALQTALERDDFVAEAFAAALVARFSHPQGVWRVRLATPVPDRLRKYLREMEEHFHADWTPPGGLPQALSDFLDAFPEFTGAGSREQEDKTPASDAAEPGPETGDADDEKTGDSRPSIGDSADSDGEQGEAQASAASTPEADDGAGRGHRHDPLAEYPETEGDDLGQLLQKEMQRMAADYQPTASFVLRPFEARVSPLPPDPQAVRLARALTPRFQSRKGGLEVAAPGRLDRLSLVRGEPVPLRMSLPGRDAPAPQLVLAIDLSGSMFGYTMRAKYARIAAQAIALAVREAGGQVVVILFDDGAYYAIEEDDRLAFLPLAVLHRHFNGGTSFTFLDRVWRRWPNHQVLVLTDGNGGRPNALPRDRARTSVLLIASDTDMSDIAAQAVTLHDLDRLAQVFALLIPERR